VAFYWLTSTSTSCPSKSGQLQLSQRALFLFQSLMEIHMPFY